RPPAEVVLADVDGVERGVPGIAAAVQDVGGRDRIVLQFELGDVVLARADVLDQVVIRMARVGGKEDVLVAATVTTRYPAERRHDGRLVAVADVVLASVRLPAVAVR